MMHPTEQRLKLPHRIEDILLLRSFEPSDVNALADLEYDPEVKKFIGIPKRDKADWITNSLIKLQTFDSFAIITLPELVFAGRASLSRRHLDPTKLGFNLDETKKRELEIVIAKAFWGRKFGRALASFLIPMAFKDFAAAAVTGTVHPENKASLKLLLDWNFSCVGKNLDRTSPQFNFLVYELSAAIAQKI